MIAAGQYNLGLALLDPDTGKPAIRFANDIPHTDRLYRLKTVMAE